MVMHVVVVHRMVHAMMHTVVHHAVMAMLCHSGAGNEDQHGYECDNFSHS